MLKLMIMCQWEMPYTADLLFRLGSTFFLQLYLQEAAIKVYETV